MTILYRRDRSSDVLEVKIADFGAFEAWLWGLGAGKEGARGEARIWWAETFRALQGPGFQPTCIGLGRAERLGEQVVIVGVKPE